MLDLLLPGQRTLPNFFWDFRGGTLPPGATFTRGSAGWSFDSAGLLVQAASNLPRFAYDPATLAPIGYLAEMQSTNRILYSADGSHWTTTNASLSTDGTLASDGVTAMNKITATAGAASRHTASSPGSGASGAGGNVSLSIEVKQGSTRYVAFGENQDVVWHLATFDFQTGAWVNAGYNVTTEPPRQLAGGRWRLAFKCTETSSVSSTIEIGPTPSSTGTSSDFGYTAAGTETVYATAAQVEYGGVGATSYIPTAGSAVTRAQDILSIPLTSIPGWNPSKGGVLVAAYRLHTLNPASPGYNQTPLWINDGSFNNGVALAGDYDGGGALAGFTFSGGVGSSRIANGGSAVVFVRRKQAVVWDVNKVGFAADGIFYGTNPGAQGLPVAPTTFDIGRYSNHGLNGTLESIAYYAGARSDAFVQGVSR